jgi:uncharacterized protein YqjF (DUF2071 family)
LDSPPTPRASRRTAATLALITFPRIQLLDLASRTLIDVIDTNNSSRASEPRSHDLTRAFEATGSGERMNREPEDGPVGHQRWRDLLFLHQPVPTEVMREIVPRDLDVDTFDGRAWLTLMPFAIFASRPAGVAAALGKDFFQVNLRTYVRSRDGEPGLYFFSLDATSWIAVAGARVTYGLPYFPATIKRRREPAAATIAYTSRRLGTNVGVDVVWHVGSPMAMAAPGSIDEFLLERHTLFVCIASDVYRARVRHTRYPLCAVSLGPFHESLCERAGLPPFPTRPSLAHFSPGVDVDLYWRHVLPAASC